MWMPLYLPVVVKRELSLKTQVYHLIYVSNLTYGLEHWVVDKKKNYITETQNQNVFSSQGVWAYAWQKGWGAHTHGRSWEWNCCSLKDAALKDAKQVILGIWSGFLRGTSLQRFSSHVQFVWHLKQAKNKLAGKNILSEPAMVGIIKLELEEGARIGGSLVYFV